MTKWEKLASSNAVKTTIKNLVASGINAKVVNSGTKAKKEVLKIIPRGKEIMTMTSTTLQEIGLSDAIENSKSFSSVRKKLLQLDRQKDNLEMQKLGSAPEWVVGSVHAVTQDGHVLIASKTGSQLPAYVYGASNVIWVVGTQKIVKDVNQGLKRIYEYSLPLENKRALKVYGTPSAVNKILIINKEVKPDRIQLIFVKEKLGF